MSGSKLSLEVHAQDAGAMLTILDHDFNVQGRGIGRVDQMLPAGLYKVRWQLGSSVREGHVALEKGNARALSAANEMKVSSTAEGAVVSFDEVEFSSPIPLERTSRTHEYHRAAAWRLSKEKPRVAHGNGSSILIFGRAWSPNNENRFAKWHPLKGLSLLSADGTFISDLGNDAERDLKEDPWAGLNASVAPGHYRLRKESPEGAVELCLFVPTGWQLQVFFLALRPRPGEKQPRLDLDRAAVYLSKKGFDPASPSLRLTEQARKALGTRRGEISNAARNQLLEEKWDQPMGGIFAAHLLLRRNQPDLAYGRFVLANLRSLVKDHPDVEALALAMGERVENPKAFEQPPMLTASWQAIVKATAKPENAKLVSLESPAASAAARAWTSSGPWLLCSAPPKAKGTVMGPSLGLRTLATLEKRLWTYWLDDYHARWPATPERPTQHDIARDVLIPRLSLPYSVVERTARELAARKTPAKTPAEIYASNAIEMMVGAGSFRRALSKSSTLTNE